MFEPRQIQRDGCALQCYSCGDPGMPAVLLIQGVGVQGLCWRPQMEGPGGLAERHFCVAFDNRGMGKSQPPSGTLRPLTMEQMIADAVAVMDSYGMEKAHLVGHSLGGLIAQGVAFQTPFRVQSLVLMNTFADGAAAAGLTWRMFWLGMRTRIGPTAWRRRAFMQMIFPADYLRMMDVDARAAELMELFGHDLGQHPPIVIPQLNAMKQWNTTPRLKELAGIPTLILSAKHDPIARPALAAALANGIPNSRHKVFADAAHGLPLQKTAEVNALLANFVSTSAASSIKSTV